MSTIKKRAIALRAIGTLPMPMGFGAKASIALRAIGFLVFALGLAGPYGSAAAQNNTSGTVDFCDTTVYQNTTLPTLQTTGLFTDVPRYGKAPTTGYRPDEMCRQSSASDNSCNVFQTTTNQNCTYSTPPCRLMMCGQRYANINDMWITVLAAPGTVPVTNSCWDLKANVLISVFNNNKGVGFITNYDPVAKQGIYFGLFDSAARITIQLYTFDASVAAGANIPMVQLGTTTASQPRGATPHWWTLTLDICTGPKTAGGPNLISVIGSFQPVTYNAGTNTWTYANTPGTCPSNYAADQTCFQYNGNLPTTPPIVASGAVGISGFLHSADQAGTIDEGAFVSKFIFVGTSLNPD